MTTSTTLHFGPAGNTLADLEAFRQEVVRQLQHARDRAATNSTYARMIDLYEGELVRVSDQIVQKQQKKVR